MQSDNKAYFIGIPVAPDVKRLMEAFGVPAESTKIPYDAVERLLGKDRKSHRFKTVTTAWRAELLRDHNVEIGVEASVGFVALTPSQRVKHGSGRVERGLRGVIRGGQRLQVIDHTRLTDEERDLRLHRIRLAGHIQLAAATDARRVSKPESIPAMSR